MDRQEQNKQEFPVTKDLSLDGTLPHQINSPDYKDSHASIQPPFINEYGIVIGDSFYDSPHSPLNQWSTQTDPSIMSGDQWVHPTNDIGFNSSENRDLVENRVRPKGSPFMHPTKDVGYGKD